MGWDKKANGQRYYYKAKKVRGRSVKTYIGTGPVADLAAALDAAERGRRRRRQQAWRAEQARLAAADHALGELGAAAGLVSQAALLLAGHHFHHGEWRRRRVTDPANKGRGKSSRRPGTAPAEPPAGAHPGRQAAAGPPGPDPFPASSAAADGVPVEQSPTVQDTPDRLHAFRELVGRARGGDAAALADLHRFLDSHPETWRALGDLGVIAQRAWLEVLAGADPLAAEAVRRHAEELKADLLGPGDTRAERVLVDDAVVAYLAARHAQILAARPAPAPGQAALCIKRCESAERRLQRALRSLALLRARAPGGLGPPGGLRLYPEGGGKCQGA
jgi:hypothetical protein